MEEIKIQTGKSVWYGPDLDQKQNEWLFIITTEELEELAPAADKLANSSSASPDSIDLSLLDNFDEEFQLPILKKKINEFRQNLYNGLGFLIWRGLPVTDWGYKRSAAAFLLIGKCMGNLRAQNMQGHVLGKLLGVDQFIAAFRKYR